MKKLTKIMSVLLGGALAVAALLIPSFAVKASSATATIKLEDFTYQPDNSFIRTDSSIPLTITSTGGEFTINENASKVAVTLRRFIDLNDSGDNYKYNANTSRYYLGLSINGPLGETYTATFTDPMFNETVTVSFKPTSSLIRVWFFVDNTTAAIVGISKSEGVSEVGVKITGGRFAVEDTDWLEPLRTQLHIAADPEFGGNVNHTAEYTGDFALPTEIMAYIKAHEGVTLNYSFYVDDVLQTVTITSDNVVLEKGVDWYGFSYLLNHYGKGTKGASGGYTIVSGDTLTGIAKKFGTTVAALAAKNGIKNVDLIYAGAKIAY